MVRAGARTHSSPAEKYQKLVCITACITLHSVHNVTDWVVHNDEAAILQGVPVAPLQSRAAPICGG